MENEKKISHAGFPSLDVHHFIARGSKSIVMKASDDSDHSKVFAVKGIPISYWRYVTVNGDSNFISEQISKARQKILKFKEKNSYCKYLVEMFCIYQPANDNLFWISMEYVDGITANDLIGLSLSETNISSIVVQILKGLHFLHKLSITHGNIKPPNILISYEGNVKLSNMEYAIRAIPAFTEVHHVYAPSDQISMNTDIWSLGITIIELLEKIPPTLRFQKPAVQPPNVRNFVEICLEKKSSEKQTVEDLLSHKLVSGIQDETSGLRELNPFKLLAFERKVKTLNLIGDLERIPDTILSVIFSLLNPRDLCTMSLVCSKIKQITDLDSTWKNNLSKYFKYVLEDKEVKVRFIKEYTGRKFKYQVKDRGQQTEFISRKAIDRSDLNEILEKIPKNQKVKMNIIITGPPNSGKTCLTKALCTPGRRVDYRFHSVDCELHFFDVGQKKNRVGPEIALYQANVVLVMNSLDPEKIQKADSIENWFVEANRSVPDAPKILVGTKLDLCYSTPVINKKAEINDPISYYWMLARAQQFHADSYVETSSVTCCGIEILKYEIARAFIMENFAPKSSLKKCIVQ